MSKKSNAYAIVIADLKRQRTDLDAMIARLESMAGEEAGVPSGAAAGPSQDLDDAVVALNLPPDGYPYVGMTIVEAVKTLLAERQQMLSVNRYRGEAAVRRRGVEWEQQGKHDRRSATSPPKKGRRRHKPHAWALGASRMVFCWKYREQRGFVSNWRYTRQRASEAFRADSERCSAVRRLALIFPPTLPPLRPLSTAEGSFS